jgi:hypothetical protein
MVLEILIVFFVFILLTIIATIVLINNKHVLIQFDSKTGNDTSKTAQFLTYAAYNKRRNRDRFLNIDNFNLPKIVNLDLIAKVDAKVDIIGIDAFENPSLGVWKNLQNFSKSLNHNDVSVIKNTIVLCVLSDSPFISHYHFWIRSITRCQKQNKLINTVIVKTANEKLFYLENMIEFLKKQFVDLKFETDFNDNLSIVKQFEFVVVPSDHHDVILQAIMSNNLKLCIKMQSKFKSDVSDSWPNNFLISKRNVIEKNKFSNDVIKKLLQSENVETNSTKNEIPTWLTNVGKKIGNTVDKNYEKKLFDVKKLN